MPRGLSCLKTGEKLWENTSSGDSGLYWGTAVAGRRVAAVGHIFGAYVGASFLAR